MQAADVMRVDRKCALAAELRVETAARLHVLQAEFMEGGRPRAVGNSDGDLETLVGSLGNCPASAPLMRRVSCDPG
jgi:hypothetical protein